MRPLTQRVKDCLRCAADGLNYQQTADHLGISLGSVNVHLMEARIALDARNTTHAVATALRRGLIQ